MTWLVDEYLYSQAQWKADIQEYQTRVEQLELGLTTDVHNVVCEVDYHTNAICICRLVYIHQNNCVATEVCD